MVDVGVGEIPSGPWGCEACGYVDGVPLPLDIKEDRTPEQLAADGDVPVGFPQDEGILETLTEPDVVTEPLRRLFDEPGFDAEAAWHDVMRKSETVESARTAYELAKSDASDAKKTLDTRQKELEDLIKELRWKEQRADQAKMQPKLVEAADGDDTAGSERGEQGSSETPGDENPSD